ncbi:MAG: hypothetical protein ACRDWS_12900 [Acidimicrobiia bacterium]
MPGQPKGAEQPGSPAPRTSARPGATGLPGVAALSALHFPARLVVLGSALVGVWSLPGLRGDARGAAAIEPVLGPLDVHRHGTTGSLAVVALRLDASSGEGQNLVRNVVRL